MIPDWIYPVALALFVGGGAAYCWKYPTPPNVVLNRKMAEIEQQLRRIPKPSKPPSWLARQCGYYNDSTLLSDIGIFIVLGVGGIFFLGLMLIGIVSLFSMSEHELVTLLIVMACITIISGGFKK